MTLTETQSTSKDKRVIRLFISSTFKDMQAEREELVKFVFPELRRRCRERRLEFVGVDLRWGITEEQAAKGEVLPICLAEIEGCRPYFIGLLGEHYGWVPDKIDDEVVINRPWLKNHRTKSVTELEILHGVLNDPEMKGLAFFYFRDKKASMKVEDELAKEPTYEPEPDTSKTKLDKLKREIKESRYPVKKNYPDSKTLGQWVLNDLWAAIDKRFPLEKVPSELEQQRLDHEAFAALRTETYIRREEYFKSLNDHVASDGLPLVILGKSGSGKSALLANWVKNYCENHPDVFIITHYIGSTSDSADYVVMLRRIMEEIGNRYKAEQQILSESSITSEKKDNIYMDSQKVIEAFSLWLARAAAHGPIVLVIDALNQLEDKENAPDLGWLPWSYSPNVRLIVSTLPGRSLDALKKRNWTELTINLMGQDEQERYIIDYLKRYRKELNPTQRKRIIQEQQTKNPLYLRTLLEELRVFGVYEEIDKKIDHYLKAKTVADLFALVLERLEKDYEKERKGIVKEVTTLIWASRKGLSETELLEILGTPDNPMPRTFWSPLYLALEESLISRSGLLTFFHDFLRQAVEARYLAVAEEKQKTHITIADYFDKKILDDRKTDELPWQFYSAENWERLKKCVTDIGMFLKLQTFTKRYELTRYWLTINERYDMVNEYNIMLSIYEKISSDQLVLADCVIKIASFLELNARYIAAEALYNKALAIRVNILGPEHPVTAQSLNDLAFLLKLSGDFNRAEPFYRRALAIREKVLGPEHPDTAQTLNDLASLLEAKSDPKNAEPLFLRALAIREKVLGPEHPDTAQSLNSLALLYAILHKYDQAEALYRRALTIRENVLGLEHPDTAQTLGNLALMLSQKGDYEQAENLYYKTLAIKEKVLGPEHPLTVISIINAAIFLLFSKQDYDGAESLYRRALSIDEKILGDHPDTATCLVNLAALLDSKGNLREAEYLYYRALAIVENIFGPDHYESANIITSLAYLFEGKGDYEGAESLYRKSMEIREKNPDHDTFSIAEHFNKLGLLCELRGDYEEASLFFHKALDLAERILELNNQEIQNIKSNLNRLTIKNHKH